MEMAERTGLEPATLGVTGRYSNQLNYRSALETQRTLDHDPRVTMCWPWCCDQGVVGAEGIEPPTFAL